MLRYSPSIVAALLAVALSPVAGLADPALLTTVPDDGNDIERTIVLAQKPTRERSDRKPLTRSGPMTFTHVRSSDPGCENLAATRSAAGTTCLDWIAADGTIDQSSPHRLKRVLARLKGRKLPVFINSPGGSVDDSIELARIIRAKGLDVVVARTELVACTPRDKTCNDLKARNTRLGTPARLARCASSCPFALAGGVRRMVGPGAYVGLHQAATYRVLTRVMRTYRTVPRYEFGIPIGTTRKLVSEKPIALKIEPIATRPETYDKIEANFVAMGVSRAIMAPMLATPNSEMRWLTIGEVGQFRLATDRLSGAELVGLRPPTVGLAPSETGSIAPGVHQLPAAKASVPAELAVPPATSVAPLGFDEETTTTLPVTGFAPVLAP